ncbi:MAG: hypothetical protein JRI63_14645 [Deltaproteobacteria bacterium]|nr:hypothetical protein [Deltaproteobacteria bacterium]MBW2014125.1 hypothetical protein [Deltaproteobacteria bacterium]
MLQVACFSIGEVAHPMKEKHGIEWVEIRSQ